MTKPHSTTPKSGPWMAQSFVRAFEKLDMSDWTVFEWGSGQSTLWFAQRVKQIVSMEHNPLWYEEARKMCDGLENVSIHFPLGLQAYVEGVQKHAKDRPYDLVIIDGRHRVACARAAIGHFSRALVWDNASRRRYSKGRIELMEKAGIVKIERYIWTEPGAVPGGESDTWVYWRELP